LERNVVLLVDDNRTHLYSLGKHLTESGFDVLHAHSGGIALQLAVEHRPDAILLDINLPDTTGFGICQQLKADARTKSIPVVFHSATHDTASARSHAADLGAVSFLSYPINVEHLEHVIKGAIAHAQREPRHS
jgi:DNA-binding response OmpR family regulator